MLLVRNKARYGSVLSLACLVYHPQSVYAFYAASSEPMKKNVSGYSRNPCSLNRERDAAFAAKLLTLPTWTFFGRKIWGADGAFASIRCDVRTSGAASAPSANELAWFYTGFRQSARPGAFPKRVSFMQRLVPYLENKGYASNPRRFERKTFFWNKKHRILSK